MNEIELLPYKEAYSAAIRDAIKKLEVKKEQLEETLYDFDGYPHSDQQAEEVIKIISESLKELL
jgi:hypothetical protein